MLILKDKVDETDKVDTDRQVDKVDIDKQRLVLTD